MSKYRVILIASIVPLIAYLSSSYWYLYEPQPILISDTAIIDTAASSSLASQIKTPIPAQVAVAKSTLTCLESPTVVTDIAFFQTDNDGLINCDGPNAVIIFNPKSTELDFKVNVGLDHALYAKDLQNQYQRQYVAKTFRDLISNPDSTLDDKLPIAAINADYIETSAEPQGLNISRGVEYSGIFQNKRSSFGISGGKASQRVASIQKGKRSNPNLNYNLVGGNGRFYENGEFEDICQDLGQIACRQSTSRAMVAITSSGQVILLANTPRAGDSLLPDEFDNLLSSIASKSNLGTIREAILFDGGSSPGLMYKGQTYIDNGGPIGSVFLIYKR